MTTQPASTLSDPTTTGAARRRRPGRTALLVVGIVGAAVAALGALALVALGAVSLVAVTSLGGPVGASAAPESPEAQGTPPASVAVVAPPATHDDAGAVAFTQYFATTVVEAFRTGDPDPVRATSTADCSACQALVAAVADPARASRPASPTTLNVIHAAVVSTTPDTTVVDVTLRVEHKVVDLGDGLVDVSGLEFQDRFTLRWAGDHWLVVAVDGDAWTPVLV